ncbi:MAG TPA: L,D-transpeptidase family protein [Pseudolabrys sp.]
MNRHLLRALFAPAILAAAIALSGCNPEDVAPSGRSQAPLSEKTLGEIQSKNMDTGSPILVRLFKEEAEMEVWKKNRDGEFALLKTYPICRWSGDLGPKIKEGDRQAPEGFYTITPGLMNPNSNYYLAFNTGYPNSFDRSWGRTGSELMVHGDCSSRGCYAMTDEQMQEIYALARESFFGGQKEFQFEAFPFRMTALNMAKHRNNPNFAFWKMIKEGYDNFDATHQEPKVAVCEKHYVFDATAPENSSKPLRFDPRGKCPAYRLDPSVADAVLDHRRHEQVELANYIARDVSMVPFRVGDGGMNPVFEAKLASHSVFDNDGHAFQVAGNSQAPGALPRTPNPPSAAPSEAHRDVQPPANDQPVMMASVPMPQAAPQAKEGEAPPEQPKSIGGLIGNLFATPPAQAKPAEAAETEQASLRGSETPSKTKRSAPVRTASAPVKPHEAAQIKPKAVASTPPSPAPRVAQAKKQDNKQDKTPDTELRTAYSSPQPNNGRVLPGAQPMVPAGTFESRWTALR